jgi:hypothetical protein
VEVIRQGEVSFPRTPGEPDSLRAWRPWVLEDEDATLRMWYTGSDGTTSRILTAERRPGGGWERQGVAIDAGFAGDSDSYGAESPCVVKTPGGYLMVYGGSDGEISRPHMATSEDSHRWSKPLARQSVPHEATFPNERSAPARLTVHSSICRLPVASFRDDSDDLPLVGDAACCILTIVG